MKALDILRGFSIVNPSGEYKLCSTIVNECVLEEAILELEDLQKHYCKHCKNLYKHNEIDTYGCLKGYSTFISYGLPCVFLDFGCVHYKRNLNEEV